MIAELINNDISILDEIWDSIKSHTQQSQPEVSAETIANKLKAGNTEWTPEELQFQKNNPQEVESALRNKSEAISFDVAIDRIFSGQHDGLQRRFFDVADTPEFMKDLGI